MILGYYFTPVSFLILKLVYYILLAGLVRIRDTALKFLAQRLVCGTSFPLADVSVWEGHQCV
jgi:hypothetical protein